MVDVAVLERRESDLGRRERKKLETRRALFRVAVDLFSQRGVDATTVEDIADAVDVSARTFHRYFASKEEVLFFDAAERRARFGAFLADRPDEEPLLDSLRAAAHDLAAAFLGDPDDDRRRLRLVRGSVTLRAQNLHHTDLLSQIVVEYAAARLAIDAHDPLPRLLAACTIAALRTARERSLDEPSRDPHREIDRCFDLVADLRAATMPSPRGGSATTTTTEPLGPAAVRPGLNPWVPLSVIMAATIMVVLDSTIVNVALHQIGLDLGAGDGIEWIVTAYLLAVCMSQPATGWLADRYGRKRVFLASLVSFTLASVACAAAPTLGVLIAFRILQGIGGGAMMPVGMTMVFELFPKAQHGRAIAVWGMSAMVAPAIGPTLGGWLVTSVSWHWLFLINVPIGVVALVAGIRLLPDIGHRERRPFDLPGLLFGGVGLAAAVVGVAQGTAWGWRSPATILCIVGGLGCLTVFTRHELRSDHPLIELRMFEQRAFRLAIGAFVFVMGAEYARLVFVPLQLEGLRGFTAMKVGMMFFVPAVFTAVGMSLGGRLVDRVGPAADHDRLRRHDRRPVVLLPAHADHARVGAHRPALRPGHRHGVDDVADDGRGLERSPGPVGVAGLRGPVTDQPGLRRPGRRRARLDRRLEDGRRPHAAAGPRRLQPRVPRVRCRHCDRPRAGIPPAVAGDGARARHRGTAARRRLSPEPDGGGGRERLSPVAGREPPGAMDVRQGGLRDVGERGLLGVSTEGVQLAEVLHHAGYTLRPSLCQGVSRRRPSPSALLPAVSCSTQRRRRSSSAVRTGWSRSIRTAWSPSSRRTLSSRSRSIRLPEGSSCGIEAASGPSAGVGSTTTA